MSFSPYNGDLMGIYNNEKYLVFRWDDPDCKILFSMCKQGRAANCNFASDKRGLRRLRVAVKEFLDFVFTNFKWCDMILAETKLNSVKKFQEKLGFKIFAKNKDCDFYYLPREVYYR